MDPIVTAMWSQDRKVRSLAKKVLGSMRMGVVRAMGGGPLASRLLKYQSKKPFFSFFCPKPACSHRFYASPAIYRAAEACITLKGEHMGISKSDFVILIPVLPMEGAVPKRHCQALVCCSTSPVNFQDFAVNCP